MSLFLSKLKHIVENIPEPVSNKLIYVPFSVRFGKPYTVQKLGITEFSRLPIESKKSFVFNKTKAIVEYAFNNNLFYKEFYSSKQFLPSILRCFDDLKEIPIVTKNDLRTYNIEQRSCPSTGRMKINTGGTSGEPLEFYIDKQAFAREWAHMHVIWETLGYKTTDIKLTFRGKNLGDNPLKYNAVHNEYIINAYCDLAIVCEEIQKLVVKRKITFLHGYPSAIYNFTDYCRINYPDLAKSLSLTLKGIFFGSEYPAPFYRDVIESTFNTKTVSWFGHSEMALLAYESNEKFNYEPMQTYGYCEAIRDESGSERLIATSYYNIASPFIRYDTGDLVNSIYQDDLLKSFQVESGRVGEFVIDQRGQRISLTALIFGRHHEAFGRAKFIQIAQPESGSAIIYITPRENNSSENWADLFDMSNIAMDFQFKTLIEPVRTRAGKVTLLVNKQ